MSGDIYVCELCDENDKATLIPADEVGAALMQEHLKSEHGVVALAFKTCSGCGHSVAALYPPDDRPITCKDHS